MDGNASADDRRQLMAPATLQDLDEALAALRGAPILHKAALAEQAIELARRILGQHEARLAALELRAARAVAP